MTHNQIPKLDKKGLREFGLISGAILVVLFGLLLPWLRGHSLLIWPWIVAGVLWVWALIAPMTLNPVYQVWMRIGLALGWVNTRIILGVVFYALIMPMGLIMRLLKQDPMRRSFEANLDSYRIVSINKTRESMEKPF